MPCTVRWIDVGASEAMWVQPEPMPDNYTYTSDKVLHVCFKDWVGPGNVFRVPNGNGQCQALEGA